MKLSRSIYKYTSFQFEAGINIVLVALLNFTAIVLIVVSYLHLKNIIL